MSEIKLRIMVRAFRIRIAGGETFEEIVMDYPALTEDDVQAIRQALEK